MWYATGLPKVRPPSLLARTSNASVVPPVSVFAFPSMTMQNGQATATVVGVAFGVSGDFDLNRHFALTAGGAAQSDFDGTPIVRITETPDQGWNGAFVYCVAAVAV